MYDLNSNGYIEKEEIREVITGVLKLQSTELSDKGLDLLIEDCMTELDSSNQGKIKKGSFFLNILIKPQ